MGAPYQYDAAGNMIHDASHSYTYDAENRIIKVDSGSTGTYLYDADGRRAQRTEGGFVVNYVYNLSGNVVAEVQGTTWSRGFVYLNGAAVAQYWGGSTQFFTRDHLGSTRLLTSPNKSVYDSIDYLPFGEQISVGGDTSHKFTGKERDSESGLDNFGARYDSSSMGRFMTPDWSAQAEPVPYAKLDNPQSLNLYSYVLNNPLSLTDADGHVGKCEGDVAQCSSDLQKLAPGTKVAEDGTVSKAGLFQRIWNHLDGNGAGTSLVSDIVNTSTVVHISTDPGSRNGSTEGDASNVFIKYDPTGGSNETRSGGADSEIAPVEKPGQLVLGHELIHATHIADGTIDYGYGVHSFSEVGANFSERWRSEEFRTVGFKGFTHWGDTTENQLRHQFGVNDRAAYLNRDRWTPQP